MNVDIRLVVDAVSNEKNVPKGIVFEAIEAALESATRKLYGAAWDVHVVIDRTTGTYTTFRRWTVVAEDAVQDYTPDLTSDHIFDNDGNIIHS